MPNKEDRTLPNWQRTPAEYEAEGWRMVDGNPLKWENVNTGEKIDKTPQKIKGGK